MPGVEHGRSVGVHGTEGRPPSLSELRRNYDVHVDGDSFVHHPVGFESECWIVDGAWFVKVWRHEGAPLAADPRHPTFDLALLDQLAERLPVPAAVRTRDGDHSATAEDGRRYALFPYVRGRHATGPDDWKETARALRRVHEVTDVAVPPMTFDESPITDLSLRLDHPWLRGRAGELEEWLARFERVIRRARDAHVATVLCHNDFGGENLLLGDDGRTVAILDWDWAMLAPREHDVWIATGGPNAAGFLLEYGAGGFDLDHVEYAMLRRALGDMAARVVEEIDRPGVAQWGWDRLARLEENLALFR